MKVEVKSADSAPIGFRALARSHAAALLVWPGMLFPNNRGSRGEQLLKKADADAHAHDRRSAPSPTDAQAETYSRTHARTHAQSRKHAHAQRHACTQAPSFPLPGPRQARMGYGLMRGAASRYPLSHAGAAHKHKRLTARERAHARATVGACARTCASDYAPTHPASISAPAPPMPPAPCPLPPGAHTHAYARERRGLERATC